MMKANYEIVSDMWDKIIDSYHLDQRMNQDYDLGVKQALINANRMLEEQGWNKEDFYSEMDRRNKSYN